MYRDMNKHGNETKLFCRYKSITNCIDLSEQVAELNVYMMSCSSIIMYTIVACRAFSRYKCFYSTLTSALW